MVEDSFKNLKELASDPDKKWENLGNEQKVTISRLEGGSSAPKTILQFTNKSQYQFGDVSKTLFSKIWGSENKEEKEPLENKKNRESGSCNERRHNY